MSYFVIFWVVLGILFLMSRDVHGMLNRYTVLGWIVGFFGLLSLLASWTGDQAVTPVRDIPQAPVKIVGEVQDRERKPEDKESRAKRFEEKFDAVDKSQQ